MTTLNVTATPHKMSFKHVAVFTLAILLVPLVAGMFFAGVNWSLFDFVVMGGLLFLTGSTLLLIQRHLPKRARMMLIASTLLLFAYIWIELAVGVFFQLGS